MIYVSVQNQLSGVDCGFFAYAFAYELISDQDPQTASFASRDLRRWFADNFTNTRAQRLPGRRGRHSPRVGKRNIVTTTRNEAVKWQMDRTGTSPDLKGLGTNVHLTSCHNDQLNCPVWFAVPSLCSISALQQTLFPFRKSGVRR